MTNPVKFVKFWQQFSHNNCTEFVSEKIIATKWQFIQNIGGVKHPRF